MMIELTSGYIHAKSKILINTNHIIYVQKSARSDTNYKDVQSYVEYWGGNENQSVFCQESYEEIKAMLSQEPPISAVKQVKAEIIGLKELLEEVQKADDALSAGDNNEALIRVRTAWAAASIVKNHVSNRSMFKIQDTKG